MHCHAQALEEVCVCVCKCLEVYTYIDNTYILLLGTPLAVHDQSGAEQQIICFAWSVRPTKYIRFLPSPQNGIPYKLNLW